MTRHIDFEGIDNFRDFGGYATACGRGVKRGRLFRSASHHRATDADLRRLSELGVTVVVDLRQPQERVREPSRRWEGFGAEVVENDIVSDHPDWLVTLRQSDLTPEWFFQDALEYYRRLPHEPRHVDLFRRYFAALARSDGAVVVHCAAGKDRTGMICALTHHIAGVHPDDLLDDYLLTNDEARIARKTTFLGQWLERSVGRVAPEAALRVAASVRPEYLRTAFAAMTTGYGSVDAYLETVLELNGELRARIHDRILGA